MMLDTIVTRHAKKERQKKRGEIFPAREVYLQLDITHLLDSDMHQNASLALQDVLLPNCSRPCPGYILYPYLTKHPRTSSISLFF